TVVAMAANELRVGELPAGQLAHVGDHGGFLHAAVPTHQSPFLAFHSGGGAQRRELVVEGLGQQRDDAVRAHHRDVASAAFGKNRDTFGHAVEWTVTNLVRPPRVVV